MSLSSGESTAIDRYQQVNRFVFTGTGAFSVQTFTSQDTEEEPPKTLESCDQIGRNGFAT
jgi:hypothetical protein